MKRIALGLIAAAFALGPFQPASGQDPAEHVVEVVDLQGVIDPTNAGYLADRIRDAAAGGSEVVIVQLDTPGGLDVSMRDMVKEIVRAEVPVVVWVGPPGARAASAGVFLVYASHVAAMAPGTNLGAAHPVNLGGGLAGAAEQKAVNDAAALLRSLAAERGRDPEFAEEAVRQSVSLTEVEALERGVIELTADSIPDLLTELDGRTVQLASGARTLVTEIGPQQSEKIIVRFHKLGLLGRILHWVTDPSIAYILLILGFWSLVFEISQPGLGIAGFAGVVSLVLAFYALAVLPVSGAALILVLLGLALFTIDVFTAGLGVFTIGGALALGVGSFLLFAGVSPEIGVSPWLIGTILLASVLFFGFAMTVAMRARSRPAISGPEGMVGLVGVARGDLSPEGRVALKGAVWNARTTNGSIAKGASVRVRQVDGLTLVVEEDQPREGDS